MRGIVLISHGFFAKELAGSLKMIAGQVTNLYWACLEESDGPESFTAKLKALEADLAQYDEILVFADLFGGSPCNNAVQYFYNNKKARIISGMNFPMILTALLSETESVESLIAQGREAIVDVQAFMKNMMSDDED